MLCARHSACSTNSHAARQNEQKLTEGQDRHWEWANHLQIWGASVWVGCTAYFTQIILEGGKFWTYRQKQDKFPCPRKQRVRKTWSKTYYMEILPPHLKPCARPLPSQNIPPPQAGPHCHSQLYTETTTKKKKCKRFLINENL